MILSRVAVLCATARRRTSPTQPQPRTLVQVPLRKPAASRRAAPRAPPQFARRIRSLRASVSVPSRLWKVTRTSSENFPAGTFFPRNTSTASTEVIAAQAQRCDGLAHGCERRAIVQRQRKVPLDRGKARNRPISPRRPRGSEALIKRIERKLRKKNVLANLERLGDAPCEFSRGAKCATAYVAGFSCKLKLTGPRRIRPGKRSRPWPRSTRSRRRARQSGRGRP